MFAAQCIEVLLALAAFFDVLVLHPDRRPLVVFLAEFILTRDRHFEFQGQFLDGFLLLSTSSLEFGLLVGHHALVRFVLLLDEVRFVNVELECRDFLLLVAQGVLKTLFELSFDVQVRFQRGSIGIGFSQCTAQRGVGLDERVIFFADLFDAARGREKS